MNNGASDLKPSARERLRKSRERIDEMRAEAQAKARRAVRITDNYAHDHPWRIAATSVALGFVTGFLMNTRRPKRIVVKTQRPTIKVKAPKPEKKRHSGADTLKALVPLVLFGLKAYSASRPKNQVQPETAPEMSAPVP
jgi:hypothetical protein